MDLRFRCVATLNRRGTLEIVSGGSVGEVHFGNGDKERDAKLISGRIRVF
jgi:hypothetical protein